MRHWADHEKLPSEIILTWREGAYYVSKPNFLEEGESVRLLVTAPPLVERGRIGIIDEKSTSAEPLYAAAIPRTVPTEAQKQRVAYLRQRAAEHIAVLRRYVDR